MRWPFRSRAYLLAEARSEAFRQGYLLGNQDGRTQQAAIDRREIAELEQDTDAGWRLAMELMTQTERER